MSGAKTIVALVTIAVAAGSAAGRIVHVPADLPTIQAGIDAASSGDTVLADQGIYVGVGNRDIDFRGKPIVVLAESGPAHTTIDCESVGRGLYFGTGEDTLSVVSGFTITRGRAVNGGGALCQGASPKFVDMVFVSNQVSSAGGSASGGGVACIDGAPVFLRCVFSHNTAIAYPNPYAGGGGLSGLSSSLVVRGCRFESNGANNGGAIRCAGAFPSVVDCIFDGNGSGACTFVNSAPTVVECVFQHSAGGYALELAYSTSVVEDCLFRDNTTAGGLLVSGLQTHASVRRCEFLDNGAIGDEVFGAAVRCEQGRATMSYCDFIGNAADLGGVAFCSSGRATFLDCTIYGNRAPSAAVAYGESGSRLVFAGTIIAYNQGGQPIQTNTLWGPSVVSLTCSDVYGNTGGDWVGEIADQLGLSGNFSGDPMFCSTTPPLDLSLGTGSPCAVGAQPGCGLIGAHDVGCPTEVQAWSWGAIKAMFR